MSMKKLGVLVLCLQVVFVSAQQKTEIHSHRGSRGLMPENTIQSMKVGLDYSAVLEMDISFSKDEKVMVSHDQWLNSVYTLDENGREIPKGKGMNLYEMNYADIRKYDVGMKVHPKFPRQKKIAAYIPLLEELIDSVEAYAKEKNYKAPRYNIETKTKIVNDKIFHPAPEEFVERLMEVIKKKKIEDRVIIQSFDVRTLEIINKKYKGVLTSYIVPSGTLADNLKNLSFKPDFYSISYKLIDQQLVDDCRRLGIKLIAGTSNDNKADFGHLIGLGVDAIITDYPDLVK